MPYATNRELNEKIKKAHPTVHGQDAFRKTFNDALEKYKNEKIAFKVAHAAADYAEQKAKRETKS